MMKPNSFFCNDPAMVVDIKLVDGLKHAKEESEMNIKTSNIKLVKNNP